jgi:mycothiol synthase
MDADVRPMEPEQVAPVEALVASAEAGDGIGPLSEHARLHLARRGGTNLVVAGGAGGPDGAIAGFAHLDVGADDVAAAELVVDPSRRQQGVGTALVQELEARAGHHELRIWAHGQLPGAVALAARLGFQPIRELWQMQRSLVGPGADPLPDAASVEGLRLRAFRVGEDEEGWLRVNARAFAHHAEQGGWTIEDLTDREATAWFDPEGFLLAEDIDEPSGTIAGYHWTKQHPQAGAPPLGEVYVLGVDPAYQGRGLGIALTLAGLQHLRSRGVQDVMLYVDGDNAPAIATYRRLGFERTTLDVMYARTSGSPAD